jgi:hypothetical protein
MVSEKVRLRQEFLKNKDLYRRGIISKVEYNQIKNTYEREKATMDLRSLQKFESAQTEGKTEGNISQSTITETKTQLVSKATGIPVTPPKQQVTQITDQRGRTYTGKEVNGQFIGVRTVSKREQQLKASERAGFYSILPTEKTKAQVIAEQTAIRGSVGIYSPRPLTDDVKYTFEKPKIEIKKELTQAEKDRNAFKIIGGGLKRTGSFFATPFTSLYKTTAQMQKELTANSETGYSLFGKTEIPKWVSKVYDSGYKQFPKEDLLKIGILSTPAIFQGKNILTTYAGTTAGKLTFNIAGKGLGVYTGDRFIKNPNEETFGDLLTVAAFPSYAKYGEGIASVYGKNVINIQTSSSEYFNKYGTSILLAPTGMNIIGGRGAKIRAGRISKAQQRQQSYGIYKNQKVFLDKQTGEVGIRIRNQELKNTQFTKERVIRVDPFSKEITQIKDVQTGGRGTLTTNLRQDLSFKGKPSQTGFSKLYPKGYGSQRIRIGRQELIGITMISRGGFSYTPSAPKSFLPVKSLPKNLPKIIAVKGSQQVTTLGSTQSVRFPKTPYTEPPQETKGFRTGMKENLFRNLKIQQNLKQGNLFIGDLSKSVNLLPPLEQPMRTTFQSPMKVIDVDTVNKGFSVVSLAQLPKFEMGRVSTFKINSISKQDTAQSQLFAQKQAYSFKTEQLQKQSLMFDFAYKPVNIQKTKYVTTPQKRDIINIAQNRPIPIRPVGRITLPKPNRPIPIRPVGRITLPKPFYFTAKKKTVFPKLLKSSFKVEQPKSYTPSLRASLFGLSGDSLNLSSGLEERLLKKKRRN